MLPKYQGDFNTSLKTTFKHVISVLINHQLLGKKRSLMLKNFNALMLKNYMRNLTQLKTQTRFSHTNQ